MASSLHDPKLLYAIPGVSAYHIANGVEESLTPAGPQTLSLLMVPTASPFADQSLCGGGGSGGSSSADQEEDFYLHLHLPPELDLPLPATTQIYHQPPTSYLIPRWDLGRNSGVFTRIEFPPVGSRKGLQEDVDTFETILAQCTAFLERAPPPKLPARNKSPAAAAGSATVTGATKSTSTASAAAAARARDAGVGSSSNGASSSRYQQAGCDSGKARTSASVSASRASVSSRSSTWTEDLPPYNPATFKPGEGYATGSHSSHAGGQIVLVDEEDGSVIGELGEGFQVIEDKALRPGSKDPVEITLPTEAVPSISVTPMSTSYAVGTDAEQDLHPEELHPAYKKSTLVSNAAAASRLIVATSEMVAKALQGQADKFAERAVPTNKPITFQPSTHAHIRRINTLSAGAAGLSSKAVGQIGKVAQNVGAKLAGHKAHDSVDSAGTTATAKSSRRTPASGLGPDGRPLDNFQPGLLNKSLMAFSTVADGIEQAGRHLLDTSSTAATTVVSSKWGSEAGEVTRHLTSGIKNVGLVYIDVTGVSRRAIIKSVAKGMVVGHVPGGGQLIVGGDGAGAGAGRTGTMARLLSPNPSAGSSADTSRAGSRSTSRSASQSGSQSASRSASASASAPISRVRSTNEFSDNNPFRGR